MRSVPDGERKRMGINIRAARLLRGLTQEQLASVLGVSWLTVSRWERGEKYPSRHRTVIQRVLGIEVL